MMMNPLALMKALRMRRGNGLEIETTIKPLGKEEESFDKTPDQENDEILAKSKKSKEQEDDGQITSEMNDEDMPLQVAPVQEGPMDDETMKKKLRDSILKKQKGAM